MKRYLKNIAIITILVFAMQLTTSPLLIAQERGKKERGKESPESSIITERPRGWEEGRKEGWGDEDLPPGLRKKGLDASEEGSLDESRKPPVGYLREGYPSDTYQARRPHRPNVPPGWQEGKKEGWGEGELPPGLSRKFRRNKLEELLKLREDDPEKFKEIVKNRQVHLREKLAQLQEENPEKFKALMEKRRGYERERLEQLRRENPEKFKELLQRKKAHLNQRLENLRQKDPARYEEIMEKRKHYRKGFARETGDKFPLGSQGEGYSSDTYQARRPHRPNVPPGWQEGKKEGWGEGKLPPGLGEEGFDRRPKDVTDAGQEGEATESTHKPAHPRMGFEKPRGGKGPDFRGRGRF